MIKIRNKRIALLLVLMMLATMFVGVGTASAAGNIQALTTPTISDGDSETLGKIKVTIPAGVIAAGHSIVVNLPDDYEFKTAVTTGIAAATPSAAKDNEIYVPATIDGTKVNSLVAANLTVSGGIAGSDSFTINAAANQDTTMIDGVFYIVLDDIDASDASSGDAVVTFDGSTNTGFPRGNVIVGILATDGDVTLSASSLDTSNDTFGFTLRIKESLAGSFVDKNKSIRIKLPSGYEWTTVATPAVTTVWGDNTVTIGATFNASGDTMTLKPGAASSEVSCWEIPVSFQVEDESDVEAGAIEATISGDTSLTVNKLKVGTYGDYDATIEAGETVPTIFAGFEEQEIAEIIVKESMAGSLQANRTVTLTLPAGARWQEAIDGIASPESFDSDGITLTNTSFTGADDRTAKYTVSANSTSAAELTLENAEVAVEPGFTGDLVVTVGGNAGLKGEITVAKVITPVAVAVSAKTDIEIGQAGQAVGDITITEAEAGAIAEGDLILRLPEGFKWSNRGTVSVESGNTKIDSTTTKGDSDRNLIIDVTSDSTTASEILLTGATITVNRTVAEGEFKVSVLGDAVLDTLVYAGGTTRIWPNSSTAASAVLGTVITAAGGNVANTGVFTIGSATYTINGVEKTMDVAPYISNSRTYMPIRYVAYAMGIDDSNILWDGAKRTVTLIKGDKVVQMTIGSTTLLINGAAVTMDVAPEISSDRTMLPAAFVAQAFGSAATWDATTQTVSIK